MKSYTYNPEHCLLPRKNYSSNNRPLGINRNLRGNKDVIRIDYDKRETFWHGYHTLYISINRLFVQLNYVPYKIAITIYKVIFN